MGSASFVNVNEANIEGKIAEILRLAESTFRLREVILSACQKYKKTSLVQRRN
jgi:hypothetical protein